MIFRTAWLCCALLVLNQAEAAGCRLQKAELSVHHLDRRPVTTMQLNGRPATMLVDSGAFYSFLSSSTAAALNLKLGPPPFGLRVRGYTGEVDVQLARVAQVGLVNIELKNIEFLVGGNELGQGISGVLGRNFLAVADTEYDLSSGVVRLIFPKGECDDTNLAYWAGEAPVVEVPLQGVRSRHETAVLVHVRVNGKRLVALLDTGAPVSSLSLGAARRAGLGESDLTPVGRTGGAGAGRVKSWTAHVASFELGGEKITNARLRVDEVESSQHDMILGLDYFLSHRIYVSRLQDKVYITWNGTPAFGAPSRQAGAAPLDLDQRYAARPDAVSPDNADALARRGAAALAAGDLDRALQDLNLASEREPQVAEHRYTRARIHLRRGQPAAAAQDLDAALSLKPDHHEARQRRAELRLARGDKAGALDDLMALDAALAPQADLRRTMARLYVRLDRVPDAMRQFELWASSHPEDAALADVLNNRCWLRVTRNIELDAALADCKRAVEIDRGSAAIRDSLGWTYLRRAEWADARRAFDASIKLQPMALAHYGRGYVRRQLGDSAGSEQDLAAARQLEPTVHERARQAGLALEGYGAALESDPARSSTSAPATAPASTPGS